MYFFKMFKRGRDETPPVPTLGETQSALLRSWTSCSCGVHRPSSADVVLVILCIFLLFIWEVFALVHL